MRSKMRLLVLTALGAVVTLVGCGGGELFGIRKPEPRIATVSLNREASVVSVRANRREFHITEFAVWRLDDRGERRYLNFAYDRVDTEGDDGIAIFVVAHPWLEALDFDSTYFVLIELEAEVWDYSSGHDGDTTWRTTTALFQCRPGQPPERIEGRASDEQ